MVRESRITFPDLKVTLPVGAPPYCPVTAAVKVIAWFKTPGFEDEIRLVLVVAMLTDCDKATEVLPPMFESPL